MPGPLDPSLDQLSLMNGQQLTMADLPPPPSDPANKPLADPIRPRPLVPKPQGRPPTISAEEQFKVLARQGMTHRAIADQLGIGKATVTRKMQNMLDTGQLSKDEIRPQTTAPPMTSSQRMEELKNELRGLLSSGLSHKEMASRLGIGTGVFTRALQGLRASGETIPSRAPSAGFGVPGPRGFTPSMPQFNFKDPLSKDNFDDYIKALEKHLNDVKAYFNVGPARSVA